ncbi:hypothetical protein L9F63_000221, partial [Diploptera punctata]
IGTSSVKQLPRSLHNINLLICVHSFYTSLPIIFDINLSVSCCAIVSNPFTFVIFNLLLYLIQLRKAKVLHYKHGRDDKTLRDSPVNLHAVFSG